jgi:hypothetical protein
MHIKQTLADNAVHAELIEHCCDELIAIKEAVPASREVHLVEAAFCLAKESGWGDSDAELKAVFRRVAACLRWPVPAAVRG